MKSRELKTIHDLIVSGYTIEDLGGGRFRHFFTPETTGTVYEFEANGTPELEDGERYNIGYTTDTSGNNIVDLSSVSKNSDVSPKISFIFSMEMSKEKHAVNKAKNDDRVSHDADEGDYYWGKKYAWREYGLVISKDAFFQYLDEIEHPSVECITSNDALVFDNNEPSIAYKDEGLYEAVENLIDSAVKVTKVFYKSPLYSKKFTVKGIGAITDKK